MFRQVRRAKQYKIVDLERLLVLPSTLVCMLLLQILSLCDCVSNVSHDHLSLLDEPIELLLFTTLHVGQRFHRVKVGFELGSSIQVKRLRRIPGRRSPSPT